MASLIGDDTGSGYGVRGISTNANGVVGESDTGIGTVGQSSSGTGVTGICDWGDGVVGRSSTGAGVAARSKQGRGVSATSDHGVGVFAKSAEENGVLGVTEAGGSKAGVFGLNRGTDSGNGVVGIAEGLGGIGVFGNAEKRGVGVVGNGATGMLAQGDAGPGVQASSKQDHGVRGTAERKGFAGVLGRQTAPEPAPGVRGESQYGVGVEGQGRIGVLGDGVRAGVIGRGGTPPAAGWPLLPPFGMEGTGVIGQSIGMVSKGVAGLAEGTWASGVTGEAKGDMTIGVKGTGTFAGVLGETSTPGLAAGVMGTTKASGASAVWGNASSSADGVKGTTEEGTGVFGLVSGSFGTGVVGFSPHPTNVGPFGFAGRFQGAVNVTGPVHKSGGGFRIDHPLEPETKYLDHSFVESDEMKNIYDGVAQIGADGSAIVSLPTWFDALNEDFRYQLTALGAPAPDLHIRKEIAAGRFEIAGGRPGQRVSWQITGRRQDRWARAHPLTPEIDKVEVELGRYRHPELYDLPRERGIEFALYGNSIEATEKARSLLQERDRADADVSCQ